LVTINDNIKDNTSEDILYILLFHYGFACD